MATAYSAELTKAIALAAGTGYSLNNGLNTVEGRVHAVFGTYTSTAIAAGSTIDMLKLPKNARVLRGAVITGALGSNVTLAVGTNVALVKEDGSSALTAAGAANLLAATAHANATVTPFCATRLLGAGGLTTAETTVTLTTAGATLDPNIEVLVYVEYLQN
jgi:hypothetical protein